MARILIVEDDARSADKIQSLLASKSHATLVTRSGDEGLKRLREERFDLVVTDLMMDQGTGLDVLEWARASASKLPVLICSAYVRPEMLRPHLAGLRHRIVKKPFDADEFARLVEELLLEASRASDASP